MGPTLTDIWVYLYTLAGAGVFALIILCAYWLDKLVGKIAEMWHGKDR